MNLIIEIAAYVCECVTLLLCIHSFLGKKIRLDYKTVLLIVADVTTLVIIDYFDLPRILTLINQGYIFLYIIWKFRLNHIKSIVLLLLNLLVNVSVQTISAILFYFLFGQITSPTLMGFIINIIAFILMRIIVYFTPINKFYTKLEKYEVKIVRYLVFCGSIILLLMVQYKVYFKVEVLAYGICTILLCFIIVIMFDKQKDRYEIKQKNLELHMHKLYVKAFEGMLENIRIRQHDYKNQIAAIYGMHMTANSFEELVKQQREYCDYLVQESRFDSVLTKCNDKILAGFLYTKFDEIDKTGVGLEFSLAVDEIHYYLPIYKIIEIAGIFLDNALEYENGYNGDRKIYFEMKENVDRLCIVCRNVTDYISVDEISQFFKKGYSTKGESRGLGLYNVKNIIGDKGNIVVENKTIERNNWLEFKVELIGQ